MNDFESAVTGFGQLRQLQLVGNSIYGSNYSDISSNTVPLYKFDISGNSGSLVQIIDEIPSNNVIAINGNDIYIGTSNSAYTNGTIVKITPPTTTVYTYTGANWSGFIYNSYLNKLIAIRQAPNVYEIITLDDTTNTYTTESITYDSSGNQPTNSIMQQDNNASSIYILTKDGYINKISLLTGIMYQQINLNTYIAGINGTTIYTQGLASVIQSTTPYIIFGLNSTTTYTIYVLNIFQLPPTLEPYNYTASTIITSIVGYNTGIDFDIYYCNNYNSSTLYKSTNGFCFNEGTKILCMKNQLKDEYIAIEKLRIGDFVKTYKHGYRRVSKVIKGTFRNNSKKWNMCMYKMAKTPTNGLIEDLIVTGGHSILVDAISEEEQKKYDEMRIPSFSKLTIDNKHLLLSCCSDQFTPMQDNNRYNYYHLLLENNDDEEERFGIWANGILTETPNVKTVK
jgi:hypothetical protein